VVQNQVVVVLEDYFITAQNHQNLQTVQHLVWSQAHLMLLLLELVEVPVYRRVPVPTVLSQAVDTHTQH
jgi:hypothetical protein